MGIKTSLDREIDVRIGMVKVANERATGAVGAKARAAADDDANCYMRGLRKLVALQKRLKRADTTKLTT